MIENVMVDLETMGSNARAAIVAIGAVAFDLEEARIGKTFYRVIDLESCRRLGMEMDGGTVMWWLAQAEGARQALFESPSMIEHALYDFSSWVERATESKRDYVKIWGNGGDFDPVILSEAYRLWNMPKPWKYHNTRCYRTVKNLAGPHVKMERIGTHHNALDDAISQARHLIRIIKGDDVAITTVKQ